MTDYPDREEIMGSVPESLGSKMRSSGTLGNIAAGVIGGLKNTLFEISDTKEKANSLFDQEEAVRQALLDKDIEAYGAQFDQAYIKEQYKNLQATEEEQRHLRDQQYMSQNNLSGIPTNVTDLMAYSEQFRLGGVSDSKIRTDIF